MSRPLPWTDLVTALGEERLNDIRAALDAEKVDELDRDAFLLNRGAGAVLRELVPEDGPAEAVNAYGTLLHMIYLTWRCNPAVRYVQLPENLYWAQADADQSHEPVDGVFALERGGKLRVLAVLGLRPESAGFTTMEAEAPLPIEEPGPRPGGAAAFSSVLPGGAKLQSIVNNAELLWLALRDSAT